MHQLDKMLKLAPFNRHQWVCGAGAGGKGADLYIRTKMSVQRGSCRRERTKTGMISFITITFVFAERNCFLTDPLAPVNYLVNLGGQLEGAL